MARYHFILSHTLLTVIVLCIFGVGTQTDAFCDGSTCFSLLQTGSKASASSDATRPPVIFVPGLGMSALHVKVAAGSGMPAKAFNFLLPNLNPHIDALNYSLSSGLAAHDADKVAEWLRLDISSDGVAKNTEGIDVHPVSFGVDFETECPRYSLLSHGAMQLLPFFESLGWQRNKDFICAPFDYRFPPGETSFAQELAARVESAVEQAGGSKVAILCHSQGCLLAYHFLRTQPTKWMQQNVAVFLGLGGQFSGCSDCLSWHFSSGWDWSRNGAPTDPTWVGEMALGLSPSVYHDNVLYQSPTRDYRASDLHHLLEDAGSPSMLTATRRYNLSAQQWFAIGEQGKPLDVPARMLWGCNITTEIGYRHWGPRVAGRPNLGASQSTITAPDGDGGDNIFMNRAANLWLSDTGCFQARLPNIDHFQVVNDSAVLKLVAATVLGTSKDATFCWPAHRAETV